MPAVLAGAGKRVLIIEDEFLLVLAMEEAFEDRGFAIVGPVAEVQEAEALAREAEVDAAVLNIRLRDGMVFPAVRPLLDRGIPFVFVSSENVDMPAWVPQVPWFKKHVPMDVVVDAVVRLIDQQKAVEIQS